ncbi:MAG: valine--tRNA ligase [Gemmatimonadota bacterium]|jgi:valyl-tRNA synthetase
MSDKGESAPLAPQYDASAIEPALYAEWMARGLFTPDPASRAKPFVIVIPPPNVTAVLHMGQGLNNVLQDVIVRFERMRGRNTLWLPGTDHAGIATQNVVERLLATEGLTRFDVGRGAFVRRCEQFVAETGGTILEQLKAIGCSCDWTRTRYTLSPELSRAVREVFVRLWEEGLVYRGHRVIHWCPRCNTSLSDEEAEPSETDGQLYHIRYPLEGEDGFVTVATTRPETMLGDVAVAVSPDDDAKGALVGREVVLPIAEIRIPIIADQHVDAAFGSGFVKITPAHDADDFEVGKRHALPAPLVMTEDGRMADLSLEGKPGGRVPEPLFGMDRFEARKRVLEILKARGLLAKTEPHHHAIRHCYRCATVVEPRLSDQWFVKMKPLAEPALEAYRTGEVRFIPERRGHDYERWLLNIRDWNISRQLWWGHRIPVWYCDGCGTSKAHREDPSKCQACGGPLRQDEDVLDTWFSSWLWPFSTLGWPLKTEDLARFYPGDVIVTAPDILFFWVARMIFAGLHFMGRLPFHTVYLHGTVRDTQHRKMSKSLGNGIDPLDVVRRYGADALRFTVTHGLAVGTDVVLDPDDLEGSFASGRNFANKLWNVGRLVLAHVESVEGKKALRVEELNAPDLHLADRWILSRLQRVVRGATENLEGFRLNDAVGAPYHFLWDDFADWYLEEIKPRLWGDQQGGEAARAVAVHCFDATLRLLHPVLPYITETLWRRLPGNAGKTIVTAPWPVADDRLIDANAEGSFAWIQAATNAIREIRADYGLKPNQTVAASSSGLTSATREALDQGRDLIKRLAKVSGLDEATPSGRGAHVMLVDGEIFMKLDAADAQECGRLGDELARLEKQIAGLRAKLADESFAARAPAEIVARERAKQAQWTEKAAQLRTKIRDLGCE